MQEQEQEKTEMEAVATTIAQEIMCEQKIRAEYDDEELLEELETFKNETTSEQETQQHASSSRLGRCEVCANTNAKYTCPKCEVKTCCLGCVQIHKLELDCNGIRDRTKYLPLHQMNNNDFMSDYYFLEECTRYLQARKSDIMKRFTNYMRKLPTAMARLKRAAEERDTKLRFMLDNFTRHMQNTTYYDWQTQIIHWRVEWIFINACNAKFVDERCNENTKLSELLNKYVHEESTVKGLEYYRNAGAFGCQVLLRAEGVKNCQQRYYALDCSRTLRQNLEDKTVIEFPTIYVSYEQQPLDGFELIESDDDVDFETNAHIKRFQKKIHDEMRKWLMPDAVKRKAEDGETAAGTDANSDVMQLQKLLRDKRKDEKRYKRQKMENDPKNWLFLNDKMSELLSSSSDDDDAMSTEDN